MKNLKKKSILLLTLLAAIFLFTVGGTIAYLIDTTDPVENTFKPSSVEVDITDEVNGNTKENVTITNKSDIPVFVRVAVIANWCDANGNVVAPWSDYDGLGVGSNWLLVDGYYYYNSAVPATGTITLFESYTATGGEVGTHLEMDIAVQVIQADGIANNAIDAFAQANPAE